MQEISRSAKKMVSQWTSMDNEVFFLKFPGKNTGFLQLSSQDLFFWNRSKIADPNRDPLEKGGFFSRTPKPNRQVVTPNGGLNMEIPSNALNSGLGIIVVCPVSVENPASVENYPKWKETNIGETSMFHWTMIMPRSLFFVFFRGPLLVVAMLNITILLFDLAT